MGNKPIALSPENWAVLNNMRRVLPGEKKYESFDSVVTRLLKSFNGEPK